MNIIEELVEIGCIQIGNFKLKSGKTSKYYCDLRRIISYPDIYRKIVNLINNKIQLFDFDYVVGVPLSGILFSAPLSNKYQFPLIVVRPPKDHGLQKEIEGVFEQNKECIVIEDVITSGKSILETIKILEKNGLKVKNIVSILDRQEGGANKLREMGYNVSTLFTLQDFISLSYLAKMEYTECFQSKKLLKLMIEKKSNLAVSADVTTSKELIQLVHQVGENICLLKTHIDIIQDFSDNLIVQLKKLSKRYNFMIMEDRKLTDIGNTVRQQFTSGIYKISDWADFVTAIPMSGSDMIQTLKNVGIVLIAEMSSRENLCDKNYKQNVLKMSTSYPEQVSGFVTQRGIRGKKFINFTPGVSILQNTDKLGQQYRSPENAIARDNCDVIIVGRSIYESQDPSKTAKIYQERAWNTYLVSKPNF